MARTPRAQQYADAIDQLDHLHAAGSITQGAYEVQRAQLLAEASAPKRSAGASFLIWFGVIVGVLIVLCVVFYIVANIADAMQ